jgi:hypothetical protein
MWLNTEAMPIAAGEKLVALFHFAQMFAMAGYYAARANPPMHVTLLMKETGGPRMMYRIKTIEQFEADLQNNLYKKIFAGVLDTLAAQDIHPLRFAPDDDAPDRRCGLWHLPQNLGRRPAA